MRTDAEKHARHPLELASAGSLFDGSLSGLHQHGALLLDAGHLRLSIVAQPQAAAQYLHTCIVHLLPTMETPSLAHSPYAAGAHVMNVVEKHFVPTVASTQQECHKRMEP